MCKSITVHSLTQWRQAGVPRPLPTGRSGVEKADSVKSHVRACHGNEGIDDKVRAAPSPPLPPSLCPSLSLSLSLSLSRCLSHRPSSRHKEKEASTFNLVRELRDALLAFARHSYWAPVVPVASGRNRSCAVDELLPAVEMAVRPIRPAKELCW